MNFSKYLYGNFDDVFEKYQTEEIEFCKKHNCPERKRKIDNGIIPIDRSEFSCSGDGYLIKNNVYIGFITGDEDKFRGGRIARLDRINKDDKIFEINKNGSFSLEDILKRIIYLNELTYKNEIIVECPWRDEKYNVYINDYSIDIYSNEEILTFCGLDNKSLEFVENLDKWGRKKRYAKVIERSL